MKHTALVVAFVVLMMISCTPAQPVPPAPSATPATPPVAQPATPVPPGPKPVEAKPVPTVAKELQELLAKADQKVKSYSYLELIIPTKQQPDKFYVKGTKVKIKLYEYEPYIPETYFDTVYLDTATKTAVGRCENKRRCIWPQGDNTKKTWTDLDYNKYLTKTPYEFVKSVPPTATILGPELYDERTVTKIEYEEGGKLVQMWIDDTYGIPRAVRIVPSSGPELNYKFNDLQFNTLTDKDVTPPAI
ncbi:MAG: hypothetical protein QXT19_00160 [Candidatus Woesearchaeota archaeon]